ncbi:MAG: hypothetical protein J1F25_07905 [Prevotellaceae bacterium]|nr:hypothetical protein [Prevotellaceae bacterium]
MEKSELRARMRRRLQKSSRHAWIATGLFLFYLYRLAGIISIILFVVALLLGKTKAASICLILAVVSLGVIMLIAAIRGPYLGDDPEF